MEEGGEILVCHHANTKAEGPGDSVEEAGVGAESGKDSSDHLAHLDLSTSETDPVTENAIGKPLSERETPDSNDHANEKNNISYPDGEVSPPLPPLLQ